LALGRGLLVEALREATFDCWGAAPLQEPLGCPDVASGLPPPSALRTSAENSLFEASRSRPRRLQRATASEISLPRSVSGRARQRLSLPKRCLSRWCADSTEQPRSKPILAAASSNSRKAPQPLRGSQAPLPTAAADVRLGSRGSSATDRSAASTAPAVHASAGPVEARAGASSSAPRPICGGCAGNGPDCSHSSPARGAGGGCAGCGESGASVAAQAAPTGESRGTATAGRSIGTQAPSSSATATLGPSLPLPCSADTSQCGRGPAHLRTRTIGIKQLSCCTPTPRWLPLSRLSRRDTKAQR